MVGIAKEEKTGDKGMRKVNKTLARWGQNLRETRGIARGMAEVRFVGPLVP